MRKSLLSIFFLLVLVAPGAIAYFWLKHQVHQTRREVKREMMNGISRNQLVLLAFPDNDLHSGLLDWKHSEEFEYRGSMFDIVDTHTRNDSTFYHCWPDDKETALNQKLALIFKRDLGKDPQQQQNKDRLQTYLKTFFYQALNKQRFFARLTIHDYLVPCELMYYRHVQGPQPPPPELNCI